MSRISHSVAVPVIHSYFWFCIVICLNSNLCIKRLGLFLSSSRVVEIISLANDGMLRYSFQNVCLRIAEHPDASTRFTCAC